MVLRACLGAGALALLLLAPPALGRPAPETAKTERIAGGRLSYRVHCASCHGEQGKGDGPMVKALKVQPADLTRLALSHQGRFPREEVYNAIDGRREVLGHGPGAMPVWGATFQERGNDRPQEREVREKILDLLAYLESIQAAH
jgi:mono/diheme cytochrome c family protein